MLQVMELMGKQRINPADGNYVPSGFKEYDKRTNGFARRTLTRSSLDGHWLIRGTCNWTSCATQP